MAGWWLGRLMTAVPKLMVLVRAIRLARNIIGEGIGSVVAEKCSPIQTSSKPSSSASTDFSVSSSSVLQKLRSGGCTGIMNIPRRMLSSRRLSGGTMTGLGGRANGVLRPLQDEPRQIRVLGEIADVLVHVGGVDRNGLAGAVGGGERDLVEHALHHRLQAARADVLDAGIDLHRDVGNGIDRIVGE